MQAEPNWREEARRLYAEGMQQADIARHLGKHPRAVWRAVNPEKVSAQNRARRAAKREWDRRDAARRNAKDRAARGAPVREPDPQIPGLLPIYNQQRQIVDFARVDIADWERVRGSAFYLLAGYAAATIKRKHVYLHHIIQPIPGMRKGGPQCDHINRDRLDNRRANLRIVTSKENAANRGGKFEKAA